MPDQHALIRAARYEDSERVWPLAQAFATSFRPERAAAYLALASRRAGPFYLGLGYEESAVYYKKTWD